MRDPYQVLGVSRDASDDEIKRAYRRLSRKYHPDANINNPNKDQAEAMFKEVQEAYNQIQDEREHGYSGSYTSGGTNYGYGSGYGPGSGFGYGYGQEQQSQNSYQDEDSLKYQAAQNYINAGSYEEALHVLDNITNRTAQWYYYSALANAQLGNNINAKEFAQKAVQMDPGNPVYSQLLSQLEAGGQWYPNMGQNYGMPNLNFNTVCWSIIALNLLCACFCPGSGGIYFC